MVRLTEEQEVTELLRKVELAIGEVRVVERRQEKVVTHRAITNRDALHRAQRAYTHAATRIGEMRRAATALAGTQRAYRAGFLQGAIERLDTIQRTLVDLEGIA